MNNYETVFIVNTEITTEKRNKAIDKIKEYIKTNGRVIKEEDIGFKKLAYEIRNQSRGYYYIMEFELKAQDIYGLEKMYRITDEIMKFIIIKKD